MLFSSTIFLFGFLPIVLTLYFALRTTGPRNALLLVASLLFYAWGETTYVAVLLLSIALNHPLGLWIDRARRTGGGRGPLGVAVGANLLLLAAFKYANFFVESLNPLLQGLSLPTVELDPVHLPIGISFFTFQALTYVVDVHRGDAPVRRNPFRVALYISLFPQLIAGPIVRYRQVAQQLERRSSRLDDVALGIRRFVLGLGKKVLIANTLAVPADAIFALGPESLSPSLAWMGLLCYALQIFFDFSGYSDMAIGLGRIFGFTFPENFQHPYTARSIREFWRRWHISLSTWFRDYLYVPLGGSRRGTLRTQANLLVVFFLCGLWHGASWNFVVWGLLHGAFMVAERWGLGRALAAAPRAVSHAYALLVVGLAWVFFRAETLPQALDFLKALAGGAGSDAAIHPLGLYAGVEVGLALAVAVAGATPWPGAWARHLEQAARGRPEGLRLASGGLAVLMLAFLGAILLGSAMSLAAGTHNPFIYFRF